MSRSRQSSKGIPWIGDGDHPVEGPAWADCPEGDVEWIGARVSCNHAR